MTEQTPSNNNQTTFIAAIAALGLAAIVLLVLWLGARGTISDVQATATTIADEVAGLEVVATDAAQTAADDLAAAEGDLSALSSDATAAAETAVAGLAAAEGDLSALSADATAAAETAAAGLAVAEGDLTALSADATAAVETAAAELAAAESDLSALSADATAAVETAAAELAGIAAAATEGAQTSRSASISAETSLLGLQAAATAEARTSGSVVATATQAALNNRNTLLRLESDLLQAGADATANAKEATDLSADATAAAAEAEAVISTLQAELGRVQADATSAALNADNVVATATAIAGELEDLEAAIEAQPTALPTAAPTEEAATEEAVTEEAPTDEAPSDTDTSATLDEALAAAGVDDDTFTETFTSDLILIDMTGVDDTIFTEPLDDVNYSNVIVSADVTMDTDAPSDYCGFAFHRLDADNYYTAEIDRNGIVRFFARFNAEWSAVADSTSDAYNLEAGATNTLTLFIEGTTFRLYANGTEILSATDERLTEGVVTVMGGTFIDSDVTSCTFENIRVLSNGENSELPKDDPDDEAATDDETTAVTTDDATTTTTDDGPLYMGVLATTTEDGAYILGNADAPITVVEFADFRCPFCQTYRPVINDFIEQEVLTGRARLEFRMFPTVDSDGVVFRAVECLVDERDAARFWELHNQVYNITENASEDNTIIQALSESSDAGEAALRECISTADQYITDQSVGRDVGVSGTPAVYLRLADGALVEAVPGQGGAIPLNVLARLVDEAQ